MMSKNYHRGPSIPFGHIIGYYLENQNEVALKAMEEFNEFVEPDPHMDRQRFEQLHALMLEWFIFDYKLPSGLTPLEEYAQNNPEQRGGIAIGRFRQSAHTQFATDFILKEACAQKSLLMLETLITGEEYRVLEYSATQQLDGLEGLMGARLIEVDGDWVIAGNPVYFLPVKPSDRMIEMMRDEEEAPATFIEMIKTHFGITPERDTQHGIGMLEDVDGDDPTAIAEKTAELRARYEAIGSQVKLTKTWDELTGIILNEAESDNTLDIFKSLTDTDVEFPDEETFGELANIFFSAWNLLPHKALGGRSPLEMRSQWEDEEDADDLSEDVSLLN